MDLQQHTNSAPTFRRHAASMGADVLGIDLAHSLTTDAAALMLGALATYGALRFPAQTITPAELKAFAAHFGSLEINVAGAYQEPGHPEVMILSNMVDGGKPVGLSDAGQDWHTDMSYSAEIAFANVLYGLVIPHRDGVALGSTEFADMQSAYDDLSDAVKVKLDTATATHDFNKFWEAMRSRPGSTRAPLSPEQRGKKPPVSQKMVLRHPITGRRILYANPGYTMHIDGWDRAESDAMLEFLFAHQLAPKYRFTHRWTVGDVLIWDDLSTLHNAIPDYLPHEHRLIKRCQVMADRVFDAGFAAAARFDFVEV